MNKLLMTRTLVSSLRRNVSTAARRQGLFQTEEQIGGKQQHLQHLPADVHLKTGVDRGAFSAAMLAILGGFGVAVAKCCWLGVKK